MRIVKWAWSQDLGSRTGTWCKERLIAHSTVQRSRSHAGQRQQERQALGRAGRMLNTADVELGLCKGRAEACLVFLVRAVMCRAVHAG